MTDYALETWNAIQEDNFGDPRIPQMEATIAALQESLGDALLSVQIEDRFWLRLGGILTGDSDEGFDLDELQEVSTRIRKHIAVSGLIKHGVDLHTGYVSAKGINIDGTQATSGAGRPSNLRSFFARRVNQESLFSASARAEIQKARYADGVILPLCDIRKGEVRLIPLSEITNLKVNPDFPSEIWAWQRTWTPNPRAAEPKTRVEWIYSSRYTGPKQVSYQTDGKRIPVAQSQVIADMKFNGQTGWALGVPDATSALPWYQAYVEFIQGGREVSASLSRILYKITSKTTSGAANAAARVPQIRHGGAALAEGNDIAAVSTAGKGYDFKSGDSLAAMMALSLNVPLSELLMNAQSGGNYASSASLTPAALNAVRIMQQELADLYLEVFRVFSLGSPRIWFDPIQDQDPYRTAQQLKLLADALSNEEYRGSALDLLNIPGNPTDIPDLLKMRGQMQQTGVQAASPDQGISNGTGGQDSGERNDLRSDSVSEALKSMQIEEIRELVERFESVANRLG